jgi:hypothetical protein
MKHDLRDEAKLIQQEELRVKFFNAYCEIASENNAGGVRIDETNQL